MQIIQNTLPEANVYSPWWKKNFFLGRLGLFSAANWLFVSGKKNHPLISVQWYHFGTYTLLIDTSSRLRHHQIIPFLNCHTQNWPIHIGGTQAPIVAKWSMKLSFCNLRTCITNLGILPPKAMVLRTVRLTDFTRREFLWNNLGRLPWAKKTSICQWEKSIRPLARDKTNQRRRKRPDFCQFNSLAWKIHLFWLEKSGF